MKRKRSFNTFPLIHLAAALLLCSDTTMAKATEHQKDITTPMTTVPTNNPVLNPSDIPQNPTVMNPANPDMNPLATNPPETSRSWCVASPSASQFALQIGLDYACGNGGDCSVIQQGGSCYDPNTIRDHASYAYNSYYQKNPIPTSCSFGGTAVATNTDPSSVSCQYPGTSTTSTVLNTTNSNGARVFGAGRPITPRISGSAKPTSIQYYECVLVMEMDDYFIEMFDLKPIILPDQNPSSSAACAIGSKLVSFENSKNSEIIRPYKHPNLGYIELNMLQKYMYKYPTNENCKKIPLWIFTLSY